MAQGDLKTGHRTAGVDLGIGRGFAQAVVLIDPSTGAPFANAPALPSGTNRSGTITAGGTAQQLAPANSARKQLFIQNISANDLWVNEIGGTAVVGAAGSFKLYPDYVLFVSTNRAISIIGATTGQAFTATEI